MAGVVRNATSRSEGAVDARDLELYSSILADMSEIRARVHEDVIPFILWSRKIYFILEWGAGA